MRTRSVYLILIIITASVFSFAQTINIHINDGSTHQFDISSIDSITFTLSSNIIFFEDFESGSLSNYALMGYSGATWNLTTNSFAGIYSLEGITDDGSTGHMSVLINQNHVFSPSQPVRIDAYVKNTSLPNWNRPNTLVYSASSDSILGYVPQVEHNIYLSLYKITANGYEIIVPRTQLVNINTNEWYHWVVYYDPTQDYTKFELYDLSGALLGFIETNSTPYLSDKIGFELWRGNGVFDNISVEPTVIRLK